MNDPAPLEQLKSLNFYSLLREYESANPELPALGHALRPSREPLRLGQSPDLRFALSDISGYEVTPQGQKVRFDIQNFGLLGPNGALPLFLTEYAAEQIRHHGDPAFTRFLDIFQHRAYLLFYRAWADSQPHVSLGRQDKNLFTRGLAHLVGHSEPLYWGHESLPDAFRLSSPAHFVGSRRTADGLLQLVKKLLKCSVEITSFVGNWIPVDHRDRTCLRGANTQASVLGQGAMIGRRAWSVQNAFRLTLRDLSFASYSQLQRGSDKQRQLFDLVRAYVGLEFDWQLCMQVRKQNLPSLTLNGRGALGRTAWLAPSNTQPQSASWTDVRINYSFWNYHEQYQPGGTVRQT